MARTSYKTRTGTAALKSANEKKIDELKKRLVVLAKEKRMVRNDLVAAYKELQGNHAAAGQMVVQHERALRLFTLERVRVRQFIHDLHVRRLAAVSTGPTLGNGLLRLFMRGSLGERTQQELSDSALSEARARLLLTLLEAGETAKLSQEQMAKTLGANGEHVIQLQTKLTQLQEAYRSTQDSLNQAERTVELSTEQLAEVKRTVADVHAQVLALQSQLARIDARLRRGAERTLIEKGLLDGKEGEHSDGKIAAAVGFNWPAYGRVSAGFHNAAYFAHFRVPHEGMDIVVSQGSPVYSAADGVVFVVKDGGATGYTYVLIGHRDGFATLYGHLSTVSVYPGQDVAKGQVIGRSGGMPGTPGAGLMTTAPHLHFEVISRGVNINPATVLP
jgi:murein DD-endopeptidase MepM/ murein hydrolase activator NlpD